MSMLLHSRGSRKIYHSAIRGAVFGICSILYAFIPYLTYKFNEKPLFYSYLGISLLFLIFYFCILILYRNKYGYDFTRLRYLIFVLGSSLSFSAGVVAFIYLTLDIKLVVTDILVVLIYVLLSLLSFIEISNSLRRGLKKIKTYYTRTYKKYFITNIVIFVLSLIFGMALLTPFIIF